jgi:lipid-binding SYLF domain-containing protein
LDEIPSSVVQDAGYRRRRVTLDPRLKRKRPSRWGLAQLNKKDATMMNIRGLLLATSLAMAAMVPLGLSQRANAATAEDLDRDSAQALQTLYKTSTAAEALSKKAMAILVFPNVVKAGLVFGAAYGEGELKEGEKVVDYYNSFTGSWGLQAGAQSYSYVVFLMTKKAVHYVKETQGWEIGVGPTVVVVNEGIAKNLSTSTLKDDAYAFIFSQQGLMAGVSIEGTKISRIKR